MCQTKWPRLHPAPDLSRTISHRFTPCCSVPSGSGGGGGTVTPKTWSWEALGDRKLQISPSQTEGRVVRTDSQTEGSLGRIFPTASLIQPPNCSWTVSQDTLQNWLMYPWGPPGPS